MRWPDTRRLPFLPRLRCGSGRRVARHIVRPACAALLGGARAAPAFRGAAHHRAVGAARPEGRRGTLVAVPPAAPAARQTRTRPHASGQRRPRAVLRGLPRHVGTPAARAVGRDDLHGDDLVDAADDAREQPVPDRRVSADELSQRGEGAIGEGAAAADELLPARVLCAPHRRRQRLRGRPRRRRGFRAGRGAAPRASARGSEPCAGHPNHRQRRAHGHVLRQRSRRCRHTFPLTGARLQGNVLPLCCPQYVRRCCGASLMLSDKSPRQPPKHQRVLSAFFAFFLLLLRFFLLSPLVILFLRVQKK
eukprot:Rhum_TRINITY_DN2405_c0_g1::Rhum_TRINITY_DN2405_c0_g1_i1::g.7126::m.7126